jgi:hypothetical protein
MKVNIIIYGQKQRDVNPFKLTHMKLDLDARKGKRLSPLYDLKKENNEIGFPDLLYIPNMNRNFEIGNFNVQILKKDLVIKVLRIFGPKREGSGRRLEKTA